MKNQGDATQLFVLLKNFIGIVDAGTVSKAAANLYLKQSTLSAQLKSLESTLGFYLFDRNGRQLILNAKGTIYYNFAKEFLEKHEKVIDEIHGRTERRESLTICSGIYFNEYFLPKVLPIFKKENSFIDAKYLTGYSDAILADMENKLYDLAIVATSHAIRASFLQTNFSYDLPIWVVCSPQNPLSHKERLQPDDLSNETVILVPKGENMHEYLKHNFKKHKISFKDETYVCSVDAIKASIKNNVGIGFLPQHSVQQEIDKGELVHISLDGVLLNRKMIISVAHLF